MKENCVDLVDRYVSELLNGGNFAAAAQILGPGFMFYGPSTPEGLERDRFVEFLKETRTAFSNKRFTELDRIVDGNRVAFRFKMTGTQDGVFRGLPPTGAMIDAEGCDLIYLRAGRISEVHAYFDLMAVVQKLLTPLPVRIFGGFIESFLSR